MNELTQDQAALLAGVTTRRMRQLDKDGSGPPHNDNGYPPDKFGDWLKQRNLAGVGVTPGGVLLDYEAERARLTKWQADKAELDVAVMRGELIPSDIVARVWGGMVIAFRSRVMSIPTKSAHSVLGAINVAEAEAVLKKMVNEALEELADYDPKQYGLQDSESGGGASSTAAGNDGESVGRRKQTAKQRGKRGAGPVEH